MIAVNGSAAAAALCRCCCMQCCIAFVQLIDRVTSKPTAVRLYEHLEDGFSYICKYHQTAAACVKRRPGLLLCPTEICGTSCHQFPPAKRPTCSPASQRLPQLRPGMICHFRA